MSRTRRAAGAVALAVAWVGIAGCAGAPPPAWEVPPPPIADAPVLQPGSLTRAELDNGLRVLVLEDHRLPRIAFGVTLRRGAASDPLDRAGLAAFTAELMERGAGGRGALELAGAVEALGASFASGAGWDDTAVWMAGLSRDLDALLEILRDVVLRPRFEAAEAEKLRSETLAALERAVDDPATLSSWHTMRALYPGHRFGLPLSGTPESVAGLDAAAARAFHERLLVPGNAVFAAVGDVDPEDLLRRLGELFGAWGGSEPPPPGGPPPDPAPPARRVVVVDRPDLAQARIALAHEGIARTNPDRIAASLMNDVLGGSGFSSRLTAKIRSDAGLTYGIWSGFSLRREPGPFLISTFTRVPETRRVIDLLLGEVGGLHQRPPTADELRDAQTHAVGEFALGLETSEAVLEALVDLDVYGLPEDSLDTFRARVRAVTPEDTARLARALLHPERALIVVVGPARDLLPQLEGLGPVEVTEP